MICSTGGIIVRSQNTERIPFLKSGTLVTHFFQFFVIFFGLAMVCFLLIASTALGAMLEDNLDEQPSVLPRRRRREFVILSAPEKLICVAPLFPCVSKAIQCK